MQSRHIEIALAYRWNWRRNLIVPNVHWGLKFRHELDLLIVSAARWATEVEIKVTLGDLRADLKKWHGHQSQRIKRLYFAVPEKLGDRAKDLIPERAGLIIVRPKLQFYNFRKTDVVKLAVDNKTARQLSEKEIHKLAMLGSMRIWSLKRALEA